ncbi:tetratricopeptide repeat protein [Nonomuraea aurantiaca]|uniref:tetratricopeptide repeat protein n=1 Tax=Nonomuraea aurantiaca TaxID=2878562 RepID=UPI001CD934D8|nr:tetratricopeptide repeat protein [Nonomuraea aurantiaca]MCA2225140.1 tetratricopeptide repeat protein [Nonomuraea aurantiaca]
MSGPDLPLPGRQSVAGHDHARQAVQYGGVQHVSFAADGNPPDEAVSIAPPLGGRDPGLPLRGREDLVAVLEGFHGVLVLHGLGGCGKTRTAVEAAHAAAQRGEPVWWISAASITQLVAGMRALARRLGVSAEELGQGDAADLLWDRLERQPDRWLLVIDNADDLSLLDGPGDLRRGTGWVRPPADRRSAGRVLVTSREGRASRWGSWCRLRQVRSLPDLAAGQVLLDHAGVQAGNEQEAAVLAARLHGLPLALRLVGAYLGHTSTVPAAFADPDAPATFTQYLQLLHDHPQQAGGLSQQRALTLVAQTWRLSLDQLARTGVPYAQPLLTLLACFADAPVPYELLLRPEVLADSPAFAGITGTAIWETLRALADYALIDLRTTDAVPAALVHPLVRDAGAGRLEPGRLVDAAMTRLAAALAEAAALSEETGLPEDPPTWPLWQALIPHALFLRAAIQAQPSADSAARSQAATAAYFAARMLVAQGRHGQAEQEFRAVLAVRLEVLGERHPDTLATRHAIANVLAAQGRHGQAEQEFRALLAMEMEVLGERHPDTLATRHAIARMLVAQGRHGQAEQEFRAVLAVTVEVLGEHHPDTLTTRHAIAYALAAQGRYGQAEQDYRAVLAAKLEVLGERHPDTLATRHEIATVLVAQGRYGQAEREFRAVLAAKLEVLGPDHPSTRATRRNLDALQAANSTE